MASSRHTERSLSLERTVSSRKWREWAQRVVEVGTLEQSGALF
jgi:hypothetical protein